MRISPSPCSRSCEELPHSVRHRHMPDMQRCRTCEVPSRKRYFFETSARCPYVVVKMPSAALRLHFLFDVLELLRAIHRNAGTQWKSSSFTERNPISNPSDRFV